MSISTAKRQVKRAKRKHKKVLAAAQICLDDLVRREQELEEARLAKLLASGEDHTLALEAKWGRLQDEFLAQVQEHGFRGRKATVLSCKLILLESLMDRYETTQLTTD